MGKIRVQSIGGTLVAYIGIIIGYINVAYLFPRFFSPEEFGLRSVLIDFCMLFTQFGMLGFTGSINKFFPYFKDKEKGHNGFFFFFMTGTLMAYVIIAAIVYLLKDTITGAYMDKSQLFVEYFYLVFPIAFFMTINNILEVYCRAFKKIIVPGIIKQLLQKLLVTVLIFLYVLKVFDIDTFWNVYFTVYAFSTLFFLGYIAYLGELYLKPSFSFINKKLVREILSFSAYVLFSSAAIMVVMKIDVLMIGSMLGLREAGIYTFAVFIVTLIEVPKRALAQIAVPFLSEAWKENRLEEVRSIYSKSSLTQLIAAVFIFLLIWVNLGTLFTFIPKSDVYSQGTMVVLLIGFTRIIDMAFGVNSEIISYSKHYRFNLYSIIILAVLTVITNYFMIPVYGLEGAATASVLSFLAFNLIKYFFIWAKMGTQPFTGKTLIVLMLGGVTWLTAEGFAKFSLPPIWSILTVSAVITFVFGGVVYFFNLSEDINAVIDKLISRK